MSRSTQIYLNASCFFQSLRSPKARKHCLRYVGGIVRALLPAFLDPSTK